MKKYLYEMIIGILVLGIGVSSYYLYSGKEIKVTQLSQSNSVSKVINIKDEKNNASKKLVSYAPEKIDNQKVSQKLSELNKMLAKTQNMLKEYNSQNKGNIIIKDNDVDKLVSLDLKQSDTSLTAPLSAESFDENRTASNDESNTNEELVKDTSSNDSLGDKSKIASSNSNNYTTPVKGSSSSIKTPNNTTSSANNQTQNSNQTVPSTTKTQNSSTTTSDNTQISAQLKTLRTQIDKVKQTINQVSSNVN